MTVLEMKDQFTPGFVLGHRVTMLPSPGAVALLEVVTDPGVPGPPMHHHPDFSEFFYVCDGVLDVVLREGKRRLEAGAGLSIGPGVEHSFDNPGDHPVRFITGFSPRGFEAFFEAARVSVDEPGARELSMSPAKLEWVGRTCETFGMIISEA